MLVDCHCHFFTKSIFTENMAALSGFIVKIADMLTSSGDVLEDDRDTMFDFIKLGTGLTPEEIYRQMVKLYGEEFIAVPLMIDFSHITRQPQGKGVSGRTETGDIGKADMGRGLERVKILAAREKSRDSVQHSVERFLGQAGELFTARGMEKSLNTVTDSLQKIFRSPAHPRDRVMKFFSDSLQAQIDDLVGLKQALPDRVYPFFGVDPRQDRLIEGGLLKEVRRYVGPGLPFQGIKLYTSTGYSPTDPFLFSSNRDDETLFSWCEKNQIPVTIHFSDKGFSHILDSNEVLGDIYHKESGEILPADQVYDGSIVRYEKCFPNVSLKEIATERDLLLNHPKLWRKVLEQYPRIRINFAHMGGDRQIPLYLKDSPLGFWTKAVFDFMHEYRAVFTDLSHFVTPKGDTTLMRQFKEKVFNKSRRSVQERYLYGSDYFIVQLKEADLASYLRKFREAFGRDFLRISEENPRRFLGI